MSTLAAIIATINPPGRTAYGPFDRLLHHPVVWLLSQPLLWATMGFVMGPYLFWRGFKLLQRKRLILNIPRSTVRAAAIGAVEISGRASGPYTLLSPVAKVDCFYYRVTMRLQQGTTVVDEMCAPLFVCDGTGELLTDPRGADLQLPGALGELNSEYLHHLLARHGHDRAELRSAEETIIRPNDLLFVLGTLQENSWAQQKASAGVFARIGPGFVTREEADLQRCGTVADVPAPAPRSPQVSEGRFNLYPPVILSQGRSPLVISTHSEREVLAEMNWRSSLYIWIGPAMTLLSVYEFLRHFGA